MDARFLRLFSVPERWESVSLKNHKVAGFQKAFPWGKTVGQSYTLEHGNSTV